MSGVAVAAATAVAAGIGYMSSRQQANATRSAARKQQEAAERSQQQQIQQMRQQNQQQADVTGLLEGNTASDTSSTMLTGASGVNQSSLSLGRGSSLLGG